METKKYMFRNIALSCSWCGPPARSSVATSWYEFKTTVLRYCTDNNNKKRIHTLIFLSASSKTSSMIAEGCFTLTWMGSWVSLIGPTHSSVAETCKQQKRVCESQTEHIKHTRSKKKRQTLLTILPLMSRSILAYCFFLCLLRLTSFNLLSYFPFSALKVHKTSISSGKQAQKTTNTQDRLSYAADMDIYKQH